jgi:hypothetical protein
MHLVQTIKNWYARLSESCRSKWKYTIEKYFGNIWYEGLDWVKLTQGRVKQWGVLLMYNITCAFKTCNFLCIWGNYVLHDTVIAHATSFKSFEAYVEQKFQSSERNSPLITKGTVSEHYNAQIDRLAKLCGTPYFATKSYIMTCFSTSIIFLW